MDSGLKEIRFPADLDDVNVRPGRRLYGGDARDALITPSHVAAFTWWAVSALVGVAIAAAVTLAI